MFSIIDDTRLLMCAILTLMTVREAVTWTYVSTSEAFTIDQANINLRRRCIGNCIPNSGLNLCVYDWDGSLARCESTAKQTLRYRTQNNLECISDCDNFGDTSYQWCAVSLTKRNKCSRRIGLVANRTRETTYTTSSSTFTFTTCLDECSKRDSSYDWCNAANKKLSFCNPDAITHTIDYPTEDGSVCASRCKLDEDESKPYCYTVKGHWRQCFLNPSYISILNAINENIHAQCHFGEYDNAYGYRLCNNEQRRPDNNFLDYFFQYDNDISIIAAQYRANNPTVMLRQEDPNNMVTAEKNPILWYTILPTISYFFDKKPVIDLPLVVRALITTNTLAPICIHGDNCTTRVDNNYNGMDRGLQHVKDDERGHILAPRLGGPMETFNIFTQPWRMSKGRNSLWFQMEVDIDNFLRGYNDRYVEFTAVLSYATDSEHMLIRRPSAVMVRLRAYVGSQMVNLNADPIAGPHESTTENMYFSNDPSHSC